MAETEVSSIITNILDAFRNGSNVFRSTARKHKRRNSETSRVDEDKLTLDSLTQRPQEIKRTFDSLVIVHGHNFEVGDSAAQTALAQILLVFNTGLIKLLNHVLSDDKKARSHARNAVYSLSETAAMDTLIVLSELDLRLTSIVKLNEKLSTQAKVADTAALRKPRSRSSSCSQPMAIRRPPPTPRLQNGGWIRSKSEGTVAVVVANKTKKADQRKGLGSPSPDASPTGSTLNMATFKTKDQISPPPRYSQLAPKSPPQPRPKPIHLKSVPHVLSSQQLASVPEMAEKKVVRHPSMYIVPSDFFDAYPEMLPAGYQSEPVDTPPSSPPIPPKVPLRSRPRQNTSPIPKSVLPTADNTEPSMTIPALDSSQNPPQRTLSNSQEGKRVRPVSMMTFMTASTKLGEIPDHHLPNRDLTQEELDRIPMPYVIPDMLEVPRKKNRGLRFWKKPERGSLGTIAA